MPQEAAVGQQVVDLERLMVIDPQLVKRQLDDAGLSVVWIEVDRDQHLVGKIVGAFAEHDDLIVVDLVEAQMSVGMEGWILAADLVHAGDQLPEAIGPIEIPMLDLELLRVGVLFFAWRQWPIVAQLEGRAIDTVAWAKRRRQD